MKTIYYTLILLCLSNIVFAQVTPFNSNLRIEDGFNLYLQAPSHRPDDAGDIVFTKHTGEELARIYTNWGSNDLGTIYFTSGPNLLRRLTITGQGNVGIGTDNPGEKLSVNGNIRAHEIKVENANWPDYVFSREYQLPSLEETEKHIKEKGHLPGIPSASEVKANGISVGELNGKLLEKIEQLTLYMIELKEENKEQQKAIDSQNVIIEDLKSRMKY